MAEKEVEDKAVEKEKTNQESESTTPSGSRVSIYSWLILAAVVLAGSTGGFALSQLIGGPNPTHANGPSEEEEIVNPIDEILASEESKQSTWLFEGMEPVLANLDEPGVSRYVRATITLEISSELDREKGDLFLQDKRVVLRDWMTTYFAGLSLEDVRGSRNLTRIKEHVGNEFNTILFPDSRPYVKRVLFKEFGIQ